MGVLADALKEKFKSPEEVLNKLGIKNLTVSALAADSKKKGSDMASEKPIKLTGKGAMILGTLVSHIKPKLAKDAKINFAPLLVGIDSKNFSEKKKNLVKAVEEAVKGKLAKDASIDGLVQLIDALEQGSPAGGGEEGDGGMPMMQHMGHHAGHAGHDDLELDPNTGSPTGVPGGQPPGQIIHDGPEEVQKLLAQFGLSPEQIQQVCAAMGGGGEHPGGGGGPPPPHAGGGGAPGGGMDSPPGFAGMPAPGGGMVGDETEAYGTGGKGAGYSFAAAKDARRAQDSRATLETLDQRTQRAIKTAVENALAQAKIASDKAIRDATDNASRTQKAIREAENVVRPWVGQMEMAFDSADEVYKLALEALGVKDLDIVHPSAFRTILELQPIPGSRRASAMASDSLAMDSAGASEFLKRVPGAARIGRV